MTHCAWHDDLISDGDAVLVGAIEQGSGPPRPVHACTSAVEQLGIVPLDEHPPDSNGTPRFRGGRFASTRDGTPTVIPPGG